MSNKKEMSGFSKAETKSLSCYSSPSNLGGMRQETANLLMCKQWWKSCWVYGDQYKQYKHLLSKRAKLNTLRTKDANDSINTSGNNIKENNSIIKIIATLQDKDEIAPELDHFNKPEYLSVQQQKNFEKEKENLKIEGYQQFIHHQCDGG